ncbi:putative ATP-dependent RNA helicase Dbp73D isoform X2 [Arctopsyche grandis]|uniref:putative ATP-dependent RNA helicase Dbp73D isoform X2 n=1 Tax=Arctopsyche grandis TaxID=121162 RepID=UPI00406D716D
MSLFAVNRYVEEEDGLNDKSYHEDNLLRLKARIEERRKTKIKFAEKNVEIVESKSESIELDDVPVQEEKELEDDEVENKVETSHEIENQSIPQFKVLGVKGFEKKLKVKRVLPYWLLNPIPLSLNLNDQCDQIQNTPFLHNSLKKKLTTEGIKHFFPVQSKVIPWLLEENKKSDVFWPKDLCVSAPTGSGKTLAYVLPIIQVLSNRLDRQIRALIVLPVKELAAQVAKVFKDYCVGTNLKVALITGSVPFQQEKSQLVRYSRIEGWQSEVDIMICTAGRLVEHIKSTEGFTLQNLRFLVIDEADRIMQHIQNDWLYHLNQHMKIGSSLATGKAPVLNFNTVKIGKRPPQKLLFSATLSQDPEKLKEWGLFQPKLFSVVSNIVSNKDGKETSHDSIGKYTTPMELSEKYVITDVEYKPAVLYHLLKQDFSKVLCFTNSSQSAHRLSVLLKFMLDEKIRVAEISAALSKNSRESVLKKFKLGDVNILISTDALARGIDIVDCDSVISYDPPKNVKTYIHRIGRTGRAGRHGTAFAILTQTQQKQFKEILKTAGKADIEKIEISSEELDNTMEIYHEAMEKSKDEINRETNDHVTKLKTLKRGRSISAFNKRRKPN